MEKLEKLKQLLILTQNDTITPKQVEEFLKLVLGVIKQSKDSFDKLSAENIATLKESIAYIEAFHEKHTNILKDEKKSMVNEFERNITLLKGMIDKVKTIKPINGIDGKDADETVIVDKVLKKIPKVELDTPKQVRDKLETLKKDERLDISAIKGIGKSQTALSDTIINRAIGIVDQRTSFLIQKVSNIRSDVDSLQARDILDPSTYAKVALDNLSSVAMNANLQWNNASAYTLDIVSTANTVVGRALTISAGSTITGGTADMAGGNLTLNSGLGKGTGASSIIFQTGRTLTTGSTLQTLTTAMTILGSGNVGIGTTGPGYKLHVAGDGVISRLSAVTGTTYVASSYGNSLSDLIIGQNGSSATALFTGGIAYAGQIGTDVAYPLQFATNNAVAMTILNGGNVGIGTTNPGRTLDVVGTGRFSGDLTTLSNFFVHGNTGQDWNLRTNATTANFEIVDWTSTLPRLSINPNGNVGIGLTVPTSKLHLAAGTATAGTAPLGFTSGTLLTTAIAGKMEFLTDDYFLTITTGAARKGIVLDDGARLTSGKIPIASTNGRLIDGQTPLAGTKVYYVSDTSGGTVNRKLTFIDGILTSET